MKNLKFLRKKNKITQVQLALLLKVNQSTIAMWETGDSYPRADKLPEIAKIFNCKVDDLYNEEV